MGNGLYAKLTVRTADYLADKKLQKLMETEGDIDSYDGITVVEGSDISYGEYDEVEAYCIDHGIAFDRQTEADLECNACVRIFRPGSNPIDEQVSVDINSMSFVYCQEVLEILDDTSFTPAEQLDRIRSAVYERDYPCEQIYDYRSPLESQDESEAGV